MTNERFQCWAPLALDEGVSETEIKILEIGRKVQRGGAGEFEVTPKHLEEMVANHAREAPDYEPPAVVGHPRNRDQAPAVGWIKGLRAAADGLYARVAFLGDFASRVKAGEFRYTSPTFSFKWADETGAERGAKLLDLGILNNPFQKSLGAFALSEVPTTEVGSDPKETAMSNDSVELGELRLTTKNQADEIATLSETVTTLEGERDTLKATNEEQATKLSEVTAERDTLKTETEAIKREKDSAEIATVLTVALSEGKFAPAQVAGHGTDDFDGLAWLSDSPFASLDGLKTFLKTAPPVVDLGDRKTVIDSLDGSDAETRKRAQMFADAAKVANPSLSDEQAMTLGLAEANA